FSQRNAVANPPRCATCATPGWRLGISAKVNESSTKKMTSHFARIGSGSGKTKIGSSGQYHAKASITPYTAADAPRIGAEWVKRTRAYDSTAPPRPLVR